MTIAYRRQQEPAAVFVELVAASYTMLVPAAIMAIVFFSVGSFCALRIGGMVPWIAVIVGMAASVGRLLVIVAYRRHTLGKVLGPADATTWQFRLALTTNLFALALAALGVCGFLSPSPDTPMLTAGLLFGFCSGAVARGYIRPRVCALCVTLATLPIAAAAAARGGVGDWIMAALFVAFLAGSLETIRHNYRLTRQQIALRNEMSLFARNDALTGLPNRFGLRAAFADLLRGQHDLPLVAVHCIDLDRFKPVNDRFGHPAGDAVLCEFASRVCAALRPGDIAARLGGDEFAVVQFGIAHADEAEMFARRLARKIAAPYHVGGDLIEIGVSLGYTTSLPGVTTLDELLSVADGILYRVKKTGGGVGSARSVSVRGDRPATLLG